MTTSSSWSAASIPLLSLAQQRPEVGEYLQREQRQLAQHPRHQRRLVWIDAAGQDVDGHRPRAARHLSRLVRLRDRVVVDDAIEAAVRFLERHPGSDRAEIIAEVQLARGLNPEKTISMVPRCLDVTPRGVKNIRARADGGDRAAPRLLKGRSRLR